MTLCKRTSSVLQPVDVNIKIGMDSGLAKDNKECEEFTELYEELQAIYVMSIKYSEGVETFVKMSEGLTLIGDYNTRAVMLDGIAGTLSDIGALASQIFKSDDKMLEASYPILNEKIMMPTIKLREAILKMKQENSKTVGLDKALVAVDQLIDLMNAKTLGVDSSIPFCIPERDNPH